MIESGGGSREVRSRLLRRVARCTAWTIAGLLFLSAAAGASPGRSMAPEVARVPLAVSISGSGSGVVRVLDSRCSTSCAQKVASGSVVDLVALPAPGSLLEGWSGACTGAAAICSVVASGPTTVEATLALREGAEPRSLTVERVGKGVVDEQS